MHAFTRSFQRLYRHGVAYLRRKRRVWIVCAADWRGRGQYCPQTLPLRYAARFPGPCPSWSRVSSDLTYFLFLLFSCLKIDIHNPDPFKKYTLFQTKRAKCTTPRQLKTYVNIMPLDVHTCLHSFYWGHPNPVPSPSVKPEMSLISRLQPFARGFSRGREMLISAETGFRKKCFWKFFAAL